MPVLDIDGTTEWPVPKTGGSLQTELARAFRSVPESAPIIVIIHGYKFSPASETTDPHRHILSLTPRKDCWKALSWPRHLGFGRGRANEGLCIAFGWEGRGTIWQAWRASRRAGGALAELVTQIQKMRSGQVDIVAHSLGARVALTAMSRLPADSLGRLVLMAAADFQSTAEAALSAPAGRTAEVINVTSRENRLFDIGLNWLIKPPVRGDRALGSGLLKGADNWLDLQVDAPSARRGLQALGFRIPAPTRRVCHWWGYLRPGLMLMYRDLIRQREALPMARLRAAIPAQRPVQHATAVVNFRRKFVS